MSQRTIQKAQTGEMKVRSHGGQRPMPKSPATTLLRASGEPSLLMRATPRDERTNFYRPRRAAKVKRKKRAASAPMPRWAKDIALQSAVCAFIFLLVMTAAQRNEEVAQTFAGGVKSALTTRVDVDRALGKLRFVSEILPDAAFVFNRQSEMTQLALPCSGSVARSFSDDYSGVLLSGAQSVRAAAAGEVTGLSEASGRWSLRIAHPGGVETVYAALSKIYVMEGDQVRAGDLIGAGTVVNGEPLVYFEVDVDGRAVDPMTRTGQAP